MSELRSLERVLESYRALSVEAQALFRKEIQPPPLGKVMVKTNRHLSAAARRNIGRGQAKYWMQMTRVQRQKEFNRRMQVANGHAR